MEHALKRIETALGRIEAAAARPAAAQGESDRQLEQRHERLREAVAQSLRDLDSLIGSQPG